MNNEKELREKLKPLESSPIYAMSLGSHELFHSNIWAWMMRKYPETICKVFGVKISETKNVIIEREAQNRDITIKEVISENKYNVWIIENKFKSLPYAAQLEEYKKACIANENENFKRGILACIVESKLDVADWDELVYEKILDNIENFLPNVEENDRIVLKDYIDVTRITVKIIKEELEKNKDNLKLRGVDFKDYEPYRISDILRKLLAKQFVKYCKTDIIDALELDEERLIYIDTDYTNKNAIINAFILLQDKKYLSEDNQITNKEVHYELLIGIQIQGDQFRVGVSLPTEKGGSSCDRIFDKYLKYGWFENYKKGEKIIFGRDTKMNPRKSKQYNKYEMAKNKFVYQYFNLDIEKEHFIDIKNLIIEYLRKAKELLKEEGMLL